MAKGYWIARIDVHNMEGYKDYVAQNGAVFAKYGAKFLVRGGKHGKLREGFHRGRAMWCWNSRIMKPRWPAITHPNMSAWSRSAVPTPKAIL